MLLFEIGKSRFLQELPKSFKSFVEQNLELDADFRSTISNAIFINITFGNGTPYTEHDVKMQMEEALCSRILPQFFWVWMRIWRVRHQSGSNIPSN